MQVLPDTYAPPAYDYRRRQNERLYEANVSSVRAVVGPPQQRCWVERERVANGGVNIPGAIVGGAAVGANVGRGSDGPVYSQNVQRCQYVPTSARLDYWDVTYSFAGYEHRVQMTTPPGSTILVNAQGEPRV